MTTLSAQKIEQYSNEGFVVVRQMFEPEYVESLREESRRLWESIDIDESNPRLQWRWRIDGGKTTDRIDPILDISPAVLATSRGNRLMEPAGQLLHCEDPRVFKAKLISKWPQTLGYEMHQDYCYWQPYTKASADCFVTALLALDRFDEGSGAVEFFPRRHDQRVPPPRDNPNDADEREIDLATGVMVGLEPGDVVFFHGLVPHRSGPNKSEHNRESLFFTFVRPEHVDIIDRYYAGRPVDFVGTQ
jgi:2-aminoethylphosphonate dioxygenase